MKHKKAPYKIVTSKGMPIRFFYTEKQMFRWLEDNGFVKTKTAVEADGNGIGFAKMFVHADNRVVIAKEANPRKGVEL